MNHLENLSWQKLARFWAPLFATWLMMSAEGPLLAALIARIAEPKANLAAWGVAYAIAIIVEAPIIMILSASTALVKDRSSYLKLRNFTAVINLALTAAMGILLFTPLFHFLIYRAIGLPEKVGSLTFEALIILVPWPAAIGFRRFYQGVIIRAGETVRVTYGTIFRFVSMSLTGTSLFLLTDLPGVQVGAFGLSCGVIMEALFTRLMAKGTIKSLLQTASLEGGGSKGLTYRQIARFYYPLALTSTVSLAVHPAITFFVGRARFPLESLATIPVINGLSFIFRSIGLSYQEVAIALMGDRAENFRLVWRFALFLSIAASLGFGMIAFTPLGQLWFEGASGLSPQLSAFALLPTRVIVLLPALSVLLSFQRALLVKGQTTGPITAATILEVSTILALLFFLIFGLDFVGVTAAMVAVMLGRVVSNGYLIMPCFRSFHGMRTRR